MALAEAEVDVTANVDPFERSFDRAMRDAGTSGGRALDRGLARSTRGIGEQVGRQIGSEVDDGIRRGASGGAGGRAGRDAANNFAENFKRVLQTRIAKGALAAAFTPLKATLASIGFATAAAGAASLAGSLTSLAAALAPAAGALAGLPAALAGLAAAGVTLKVALSGVGDAFEAAMSGDAEKFAEELKGLAPEAQNVARELNALRPAFMSLRNAVQGDLFGPLEGQLTALSAALSGTLQSGMQAVATQMGLAAREVTRFGQSAQAVSTLQTVFELVANAIRQLRPAIQPVLAGLSALVVGVAPALDDMAGSVANLATRFGQWAQQVAASGQALRWFNDARAVFAQLGDVAGDLVGIFRDVFAAASAGGGNALGAIGELLDRMRDFTSSAAGQDALVSIFTALRQVGAALAPVITTLVRQIGRLAPTIARVAQAAGPGIAAAFEAIGSALEAVGPGLVAFTQALSAGLAEIENSGALRELGAAFGAILRAVSPLIGPISRLVGILGASLGRIIQGIAPALETLASAFGDIIEAVIPLIPPLTDIVMALLPPLANLVAAIAPIVARLAQFFARLLGAVLPLIQPLADLVGWFVQLGAGVLTNIGAAIGDLLGSFEAIGQKIGGAASAVADFFTNTEQESRDFARRLGVNLDSIPTKTGQTFGEANRQAEAAIRRGFPAVARAALGMGQAFTNGVVQGAKFLDTLFPNILREAMRLAGVATREGWAGIQRELSKIPGKASKALEPVVSGVQRIWGRLFGNTKRDTDRANREQESRFRALPNRITNSLRGLGNAIATPFRTAQRRARTEVDQGNARTTALLRGMPGRVTGALRGLGSAFASAFGRAAQRGKSATENVLERLLAWVRGIVDRIRGWVSGALRNLTRLPDPDRPTSANGRIVTRPMVTSVGEGGKPEVIIPLTKPRRAEQLARQSGLLDLLASRGAVAASWSSSRTGSGVTIQAPITVTTYAADPETVAYKVANRLARTAVKAGVGWR